MVLGRCVQIPYGSIWHDDDHDEDGIDIAMCRPFSTLYRL